MRLLASTFATSPTGEKVFLAAGTEAPEWAQGVITNPAVLPQTATVEQDGEPAPPKTDQASAPAPDEDAELRTALEDKTVDQLRDLAHEQGLPTGGKKAELIDRLLG
ncbi:SAP domain-containing protein [Kocuria sp. CPCC 205297]|uniref:SAP domain-containing protein n=1 Tax=Kocuria sp. CPCC 205297 TaxID=3073558 RepID=UPI0034D49800